MTYRQVMLSPRASAVDQRAHTTSELILYIHFCSPYWHQPLPTNLKKFIMCLVVAARKKVTGELVISLYSFGVTASDT
jgi:hypothetical protein